VVIGLSGKHQVMSAKPEFVVNNLTRPAPGAATGGFVINLTSSTTPMALSQPKDPTLAQYTFFVSRRREDGRERFRLHMGYFETQQAAEEMLAIVREVYPQAWAGEAPGKKLRPKESAAPVAAAAPPAAARAPAPVAARPPVAARAPTPAPTPAPVAVGLSKTIPAPDSAPARPLAAQPAPAPVHVPAVASPVSSPKFEEPFLLTDDEPDFRTPDVPVVHPPATAKVVSQPAPVAAKPAPKPAAKPAPAAAARPPAKPVAQARPPAKPAPKAPPVAQKPVAKPAPAKPAVKATPAKPPLVAPKIAAKVSAPQFQPAAAKPAPKAPEPTVMMPIVKPAVQQPTMSAAAAVNNVRQVIEELDDLSDTQTIRLLERHNPYKEGSQEASADEAIRVIKPEDAQSMAAIKNAVTRNAPVLFAVQLDWSVAPFDMAKVPPLAIFNAYTLYTTEANREGRVWYGLRLGFFSDAVSAKQVAYYVRSDFKTVSVVPVTTIEKERATDRNAERSGIHRAANIRETPAPTPASLSQSNASGIFQLLEDDTPAQIVQDIDGEMSPRFFKQSETAKPAPAAAPAPASDASKKSRKPGPKGAARRDAHAQVDEETLDQTLEILGAHSLEITNDSSNDTGVRHLRVKVDKKGSKFASLIDRLSGKK
jgi:hypothetical protein